MGEAGSERRVCKKQPWASFLCPGTQKPRGRGQEGLSGTANSSSQLCSGLVLLTCGICHHLLFLESSLTVTLAVQLEAGEKGRAQRIMAQSKPFRKQTASVRLCVLMRTGKQASWFPCHPPMP